MEATKSQVMESKDTLEVMDSNETIDPNDGLPRVRESRQQDNSEESSGMVRRGLLYMLLAAVLYYFAGGYNPMEFPLNVIPPVLDIFLPLLFLGGLGMVLLAVIRRPPSAPA